MVTYKKVTWYEKNYLPGKCPGYVEMSAWCDDSGISYLHHHPKTGIIMAVEELEATAKNYRYFWIDIDAILQFELRWK